MVEIHVIGQGVRDAGKLRTAHDLVLLNGHVAGANSPDACAAVVDQRHPVVVVGPGGDGGEVRGEQPRLKPAVHFPEIIPIALLQEGGLDHAVHLIQVGSGAEHIALVARRSEARRRVLVILAGIIHQEGIRAAVFVFEGGEHVVPLVIGGGNLQAQLVQPVLADDVALGDLGQVVAAPQAGIASVAGEDILAGAAALMGLQIVRCVLFNVVGQIGEHAVVQRADGSSGVALHSGLDHIAVVAAGSHQVELGEHLHAGDHGPVHRDAHLIGDDLEGGDVCDGVINAGHVGLEGRPEGQLHACVLYGIGHGALGCGDRAGVSVIAVRCFRGIFSRCLLGRFLAFGGFHRNCLGLLRLRFHCRFSFRGRRFCGRFLGGRLRRRGGRRTGPASGQKPQAQT